MPVEKTECLICGSSATKPDQRATRNLNLPEPFCVVRCCNCTFGWLNPQPTASEYQEIYEAAYFAGTGAGPCSSLVRMFPGTERTAYNRSHQRKLAWLRPKLRRLRAVVPWATTLLDVGAATGEFVAAAKADGWCATGFDGSRYACRLAKQRHNLDLDCCDLVDFAANGRTFDVVHISHVFEHLIEPRAALSKLRSLMHDQSLLVIEVPNQLESLTERLLGLRGSKPRSVHSVHHPYFYSPATLRKLLSENGFQTVSSRTYFSERWTTDWKQWLIQCADFASFVAGRGGRNLEVISRRIARQPVSKNSLTVASVTDEIAVSAGGLPGGSPGGSP